MHRSCSETDLVTQPEKDFNCHIDLQLIRKPAGNPHVDGPFIPLFYNLYLPRSDAY